VFREGGFALLNYIIFISVCVLFFTGIVFGLIWVACELRKIRRILGLMSGVGKSGARVPTKEDFESFSTDNFEKRVGTFRKLQDISRGV
jgi:hypothetical protein